MLLVAKLLGLPISEESTKGQDGEVLKSMKVDEGLLKKGEEGGNVWKMVMGDDMREGEGAIREDGA
jgi:hypothetical protein